jgi:hypothetical protein
MSFLSRILRKTASSQILGREPTNRQIAEHPALFAAWVNEYMVLGLSFEGDFDFAPDEEQCKRLSISHKERVLVANECVLLRALGACLFVRSNLDTHIRTTERYLHSTDDRKVEAIQSLQFGV